MQIHFDPNNTEELLAAKEAVQMLLRQKQMDEAMKKPRDPRRAVDVSFPPTLSSRETEILQMFADGYNSPAIAHKLFLALDTVRTHTRNLRRKLRAMTISQAVSTGILWDIITPNDPRSHTMEAELRKYFLES